MSRTTELIWKSNNRSVIRSLEEIAEQSEKTDRKLSKDSKNASTNMERVSKSAHGLRTAIVGLGGMVGFAGLAFGMKDAVEGGMKLQAQQAQLQAALKSTGQTAGNTFGRLTDAAEKLSTRGGFGTVQNLSTLTAFVRETHSAAKAQNMLALATNIARGRNMDLATAQTVVARAYTGSVGRLQQLLGPMVAVKNASFGMSQAHAQEIANLQTESQAMGRGSSAWLRYQRILATLTPQQRALATLQDKQATATQVMTAAQVAFGGATGTFSKMTSGRMSNLNNSVQNLSESLGKKMLPTVNDLVGDATTFVNVLTKVPAPVLAAVIGFGALSVIIKPFKDGIVLLKDGMVGLRSAVFGATVAEEEQATVTEAATVKLGLFSGGLTGALGSLAKLGTVAAGAVAAYVVTKNAVNEIKATVQDFKHHKVQQEGIYRSISGQSGIGGPGVVHQLTNNPINNAVNAFFGVGGHGGGLMHGFGLFHTGGVVRPKYLAGGGPSGSDTIPGWLTPGEGVVNTGGMSVLGERGLAALNAGMLPGSGGGYMQPIIIKLDGKVLTQAVVRTVLNKAARGPSSLSGGSLVTGAPGLPV